MWATLSLTLDQIVIILITTLNTQDNHGEVDGMYYNGNAPSRLNPRIPIKRVNLHGEEVHEDANLEYINAEGDDQDESAAREDDNSSLWIDPRKTPMDRIQVIIYSIDSPSENLPSLRQIYYCWTFEFAHI